jgi:hypothetical protein
MAGTILAGPKKSGGGNGKVWATFGIGNGRNQVVAVDVCPPYRVEVGGTTYLIEARSSKPGGGPLYLEFKKSSNQGGSWTSLFEPSYKLTILPNSKALVQVVGQLAPGAGRVLSPGDWLRVDVLVGSSQDWRNVSAWVRWQS